MLIKWFFFLILNSIIFCLFLVWQTLISPKFSLVVCDVGQGDAILIQVGGLQVLVDAGQSPSLVLECLSKKMPGFDTTLEVMVLTHADADHIGGASAVLERYSVGLVIHSLQSKETDVFEGLYSLLQARKAAGMPDTFLCGTLKMHLGRYLLLDLVSPQVSGGGSGLISSSNSESILSVSKQQNLPNCAENLLSGNDRSIAIKGSFHDLSFFLAGDLEYEGEFAVSEQMLIEEVDILKVGHHGSKTSTNPSFLGKVRPEISIVSVGENNQFSHPSPQVITRLREIGSRVYLTSEEGSVSVVSDGVEFSVETERSAR